MFEIFLPPPPVFAINKTWRSFAVRDIFDRIRRGKRLKTADHIAGDTPYVSSTAANNGVDAFIGNASGTRTFGNCLTVANSGSVGETFWHPYEFIASDHVTAFESARINRYSGLFIATLMRRLTEKYSFNREINDVRVRRERILLPIADDGSPDFEYMEQYAKHLIAKLLNRYLGR